MILFRMLKSLVLDPYLRSPYTCSNIWKLFPVHVDLSLGLEKNMFKEA